MWKDCPLEVRLKILEYLGPDDTLQLHLSLDAGLWRGFLAQKSSWAVSKQLSIHSLHPHKLYKELCFGKLPCTRSVLSSALEASSTDHPQQSIRNLLYFSRQRFWSSTGSPDPLSQEWILFSLDSMSLVSTVTITPYRAGYQAGQPVYAPQRVTIMVGMAPDRMNTVSREFAMENVNGTRFRVHDTEPQTFDLSDQVFVGLYLKIQLHGKRQTQPGDNLFYTVLESVRCDGMPLGMSSKCIYYSGDMSAQFSELSQTVSTFAKTLGVEWTFDPQNAIITEPETNNEAEAVLGRIRSGDWRSICVIARLDISSIYRQKPILESYFAEAWQVSLSQRVSKYSSIDEYTKEILRENNPMTEYEAFLYAQLLVYNRETQRIWGFFVNDRIPLSEEIGDIVKCEDPQLALAIYAHMNVLDKMVDCLICLESFEQAIQIMIPSHYPKEKYLEILEQLRGHDVLAKSFALLWLRADPTHWSLAADRLRVSHLTQEEFLNWLSH